MRDKRGIQVRLNTPRLFSAQHRGRGTRLATTRHEIVSLHRRSRALTLKSALIAVVAAAALLAAAFVAVPSSHEDARTCLGLTSCVGY
jgi:non-ribosomal peptide synthetase component F